MIRVLVADDSPSFRAVLRGILSRAPDVEIVAEAADGDEAVARARELRPDVVTLDVTMPRKGGLEALREIMRVAPTSVVVLSAVGGSQALVFEALRLGAVEVLAKPRALAPGDFERDAEAIREAIRTVSSLPRARRPAPAEGARPAAAGRAQALGIAAATGGPAALARILAALPASYAIPIRVVQHIASGFERGLVGWLAGESRLRVKIAEANEPLAPGTVYVGPDGRHLAVGRGRVRLEDGPAVGGFRPSGTHLLASLARELGPAAAGLVLSGMGDDGAAGLRRIRDAGGFAAAQGPQSSVVYGMPRVALESGAAEASLELDDIPAALARIAASPERRAR